LTTKAWISNLIPEWIALIPDIVLITVIMTVLVDMSPIMMVDGQFPFSEIIVSSSSTKETASESIDTRAQRGDI